MLVSCDVVREVVSCGTAIPEFDAVVLFEGVIDEDFTDKVVARVLDICGRAVTGLVQYISSGR